MFWTLLISTFFAMEIVAWLAHKYIMHGFLWNLHEDHHSKSSHHKFIEDNDAFFLIFATPAIVLILTATFFNVGWALPIGIGISAYGLCYFIVHDVFIHQRIKWLSKTDNIYFRAIRRAHKMHHKHLSKEDGECFGMLIVPLKYFKSELKKK